MDFVILNELVKLDVTDPVDFALAQNLLLKLSDPIPLRIALFTRDAEVWLRTLAISLDALRHTDTHSS